MRLLFNDWTVAKRGGVGVRTQSVLFRLSLICATALAALAPTGGAQALSFQVIYTFANEADGSGPQGSLIADPAGNFYGTTAEGGAGSAGTVFKVAPDGSETVLHSFEGTDGSAPNGGLVRDSKGNLYGTTVSGGQGPNGGQGTVFELSPTGTLTVLYAFSGTSDGGGPGATVIRDANGNLYGTTTSGGNASYALGDGVVFKVTPNGAETVLHTFTDGKDGKWPYSRLLMDAAGNLYGTTSIGGAHGAGTLFEITAGGSEKILHTFAGGADGARPYAGVIADAAGNLYGTTSEGGRGKGCNAQGCGTIFKFVPGGTETVLYRFEGASSDPQSPFSELLFDPSGNLYGVAPYGGSGNGVVFKLAANGTLSVLYAFSGGSDGAAPEGSLLLRSGLLFGSALFGGNSLGLGTVFSLPR